MKAILWGYKYSDMGETWAQSFLWIIAALQANGIEVCVHPSIKCTGLRGVPVWNPATDQCDICIYNHADISHLTGKVLPVKRNWFFKLTVPDEFHVTLDELGYGPFSSVTYQKPDFESIPDQLVEQFFNTKVSGWVDGRNTKWGRFFSGSEETIPYEDYYLVLGQCNGDEVVTRHDFGSYVTKLEQVIRELARVDTKRDIVVKLHPYMDGEFATTDTYAASIKKILGVISPRVHVYLGKSNVHAFIQKARCVLLANSGAGFEAMMHHKPIISWGYPEYHHVTYDLRILASLILAVKLDWFDAKKQDKFLYWYLEQYCFYDQKTATNRVKELLKSLRAYEAQR